MRSLDLFLSKHHPAMILATFIACSSTVLLAYGPCDDDVEKLCRDSFHQETEKTCLHKQIDRLSPSCKAFVQSKEGDWKAMMASWEKVIAACKKEIEQHCADIQSTKDTPIKAMQVCLMMSSEKLSSTCKQDMNRHITEFQANI
ncbi:MAG: hypothetical protein NTX25_00550 [Proteobacteria bacterium]|nr:hypothetical protein [Pseudomonadota bacterium]